MTGLILAGTLESRDLCRHLADQNIPAIASLAGATKSPEKLAIKTRKGGFGGQAGLTTFIKGNAIKWVIDATHPFADQMSTNAVLACNATQTPLMRILRPEWSAQSDDNWHFIDHPTDANAHIQNTDIVFLGTGRNTVAQFQNLPAKHVYCRIIDAPGDDYPAPNGSYLLGRPPFSVEAEVALFKKLGITKMIVKNAGGTGGFAKVQAARVLELPVLLLRRPELPSCKEVQSVDAAIDWLHGVLS